jgi:hypothetical protein
VFVSGPSTNGLLADQGIGKPKSSAEYVPEVSSPQFPNGNSTKLYDDDDDYFSASRLNPESVGHSEVVHHLEAAMVLLSARSTLLLLTLHVGTLLSWMVSTLSQRRFVGFLVPSSGC